MRMRRLFALLFLFTAGAARAQSILLQRFDAALESGQHSALCIVPLAGVAKGSARFICFYAIPGKPRQRDDNKGGRDPVAAPAVDPNFTVWLNNGLQGAEKCDLGPVLAAADLPGEAALAEVCPGAKYGNQDLTPADSTGFIKEVHKAAAGLVPPQPAPKVAPEKPAPAPQPKTTPVKPELHPVAPNTETTATTATVVAGPPQPVPVPVPSAPENPPPDPQPSAEEKKTPSATTSPADLAVLGLLVLIALTSEALLIERLWQIRQRKKFLEHERAGEKLIGDATNIEQAAALIAGQRDQARRDLELAQARLVEKDKALREIDGGIGLPEGGDRAARIGTLAGYEKVLTKLGAVDSPAAAVESIERKVNAYKELMALLPGNVGAGGAAKFVRDCVELVKSVSGDADPENARVLAEESRDNLQKLYAAYGQGISNPQSAGVMSASIERAFISLRDQVDGQQRTLEAERKDLAAARNLIAQLWPDVVPSELAGAVPQLAARIQRARTTVSDVGLPAGQPIDATVTGLAAAVAQERNTSRGAHEILRRLRDYLVLPDGDAQKLSAVVAGELGKPNRVLRLTLAAAVPALRRCLAGLNGDADAGVARMLGAGEIADGLEGFLRDLWSYEGDRLWETGITAGFSQSWLHKLFRAEAVLRTYFASRLAELGDLLTLAAWAFRQAISAAGYEVDRVQLLAAPPAAMEPTHNPAREFRTCPDIRHRVQSVLKTHRDGGFAVDVDSVGIRNGSRVLKRGAVVLASRIDWED